MLHIKPFIIILYIAYFYNLGPINKSINFIHLLLSKHESSFLNMNSIRPRPFQLHNDAIKWHDFPHRSTIRKLAHVEPLIKHVINNN